MQYIRFALIFLFLGSITWISYYYAVIKPNTPIEHGEKYLFTKLQDKDLSHLLVKGWDVKIEEIRLQDVEDFVFGPRLPKDVLQVEMTISKGEKTINITQPVKYTDILITKKDEPLEVFKFMIESTINLYTNDHN